MSSQRPDSWEPPGGGPDALPPGVQPPPAYGPPPSDAPGPPVEYRAAATRNRRRWARILAVVGAVLLVAGLAMGVAFGRTVQGIVPSLDQTTRVSGPTTVHLAGDDVLALYASDTVAPTCSILGPTADAVDSSLGGVSYAFTVRGTTYESVARLGGPGQPDGDYVVECEQDGLILAPPLRIGPIVGAVFLLLGAVGAGSVGATLLLVAAFLWFRGRAARE